MTIKRDRLYQGTMSRRVCRKRPTRIASKSPVTPGMEESKPTWKLLAPRRVRKTGKKGAATFEILTPIASICTYRKLRFWMSNSCVAAVFTQKIITLVRYNLFMIEIRPIQPHEWTQAKRIVYRVAHVIFNDPLSLEDAIAYYEARHELKDMDDIQKDYFDNGGIFLAMFKDGEMICTGAIRR